MYRNTLARIDLDAVRANYDLACALAPQSQCIAVIKANAYGHGMLRVAEALRSRASAFAVATVDEAVKLRSGGFGQTVLVLEGATSPKAYEAAASLKLTLMVHCEAQVRDALQARVPVWVKADTGMRRLGLAPDRLAAVVTQLREGGVDVQAVCTHLSCADETDNAATEKQLDVFAACTAGIDLPRSIANSAGILAWPASHADWIRPGIMLYGASPMAGESAGVDSRLRVAMTLSSEIVAMRELRAGESVGYGARWTAERPSLVATVAIGYADGYPRHAPNGTPTWVNGRVAPLAGTVSMDMLTIDLTGHPGAAIGDTVELWGGNVSVNEVAARAGTISYELLTSVSARVPRK
ncbi:MAG: alanine racemase [Gammaproteobacteria bacterium]|nr:alanine racemase [Gammaproteobacteria bacterium]